MTHQPLRIAFAGTPHFAAQHLRALLDYECEIVAVYSQPDRPSGRGKKLKPSPVKALALEHSIPVHQPHSLSSSVEEAQLLALDLDLLVVVAYGLLLPPAILTIPRYGCINVHASLLPRWRGAAPIEQAILHGDSETGITVMQMDQDLDTGDILLSLSCPITSSDNSENLTDSLIQLGCKGLLSVMNQIATKQLSPVAQDDALSSYAQKLSKQEALINWDNPAFQIQQHINAFYPRSPAYCFINDQRVRVIQSRPDKFSANSSLPGTIVKLDQNGLLVSCLHSSLLIQQLQFASKNVTSITDLLNRQTPPFSVGDIFTIEPFSHES